MKNVSPDVLTFCVHGHGVHQAEVFGGSRGAFGLESRISSEGGASEPLERVQNQGTRRTLRTRLYVFRCLISRELSTSHLSTFFLGHTPVNCRQVPRNKSICLLPRRVTTSKRL